MNKDQAKGALNTSHGDVEEAVGKVARDDKLVAKGSSGKSRVRPSALWAISRTRSERFGKVTSVPLARAKPTRHDDTPVVVTPIRGWRA